MNLRQIEVFRALMLAGSVTGAARLLHVSQPGVSRMLGHIELQLGIKLFERIRGKLHAKPEAEVLFREVEFAYRGVKRIEDCARGLQAGAGLSLRVLATPSLALELVPQAIADTVTRFPAATLYVESQLVREITSQLVSEEADIAISSLPIEHALLQSVAVGHWSLSCAFGASHPFAARRRLSPRDILKERLIAFSSDTPQGRLVADWAANAGITPTRHIEVRSGQIGNLHPRWEIGALRAFGIELARRRAVILGGLPRVSVPVEDAATAFGELTRPADVLQVAFSYRGA